VRKGLVRPGRRVAASDAAPPARHARGTGRSVGVRSVPPRWRWHISSVPAQWRGRITRLAGRASLAVLLAAVPLIAIPVAETTFASTAPPPPAGWSAAFSESFAGPAGAGPGPAWTYDTGDQYQGTACQAQWATGEVETDTNSPANVSQDGNGHLRITPVDLNGAWTSGRLETVQEFAPPAGGMMDVSASITQPNPANGLGYWAAFWMLGAGYRASGAGTSGTMNCGSWPTVGEINIMEDVNGASQVSGTLHCGTTPGGPCNEGYGITSGLKPCPGCQTGANTYSLIIDRTNPGNESITWYLNGNAYFTVNESQVGAAAWQAAVDHGFFLILQVGIGGNFPNGACSCTTPGGQTTPGAAMSIGYVAVYTQGGTGTTAAAGSAMAASSPGRWRPPAWSSAASP
jgi:hypothetical protein